MNRTLLYYPTIVIRNSQWIRQSILYWDSIGSIVPNGMERNLHESYDIEILQRDGLYRSFQPDYFVQDNQDLANEFVSIIENIEFLRRKLPKRLPNPRLHGNQEGWMYENKMYARLAQKLVDDSIARREGNRLYMDSQVAMIYMSLLAKHMANADVNSVTTPSTDYLPNINFIYSKPQSGFDNMSVINFSLHNVLPVPVENVQVADIVRFKLKRKDELKNFREVISEYQDKLKQLTEPIEIRELNARFVEKIQLEVSNLSKAFKADRIQFTLGTLRNLFLIETPIMVSSLIAGLPPQIQFPLSMAGATIAGALSLGEYLMDARNRHLERLAQNHYSYIYQAQQEGIVFLP